ncbi:NUDIX domain-containing protein [Nonomuraea sp. NPDC050404]|uniref:NUDIX hydrolase n=1 Tax=Nonomuraea sp. NPDC050404 TaxID=3155783 RepID=UPI0033C87C13
MDVTKIPLRRFTARVLPIDEQGRVLLLHGFDPAQPERRFWFTIGGAREDGETLRDAAARELFEEVGIRAAAEALTGPHAEGLIEFEWGEYRFVQDQALFAIRVSDVVVSFDHMEQAEKDTTTAYRWWSAEELDSAEEDVHPEDLAAILRKILAAPDAT